MPVGAFGGRREIMEHLSPLGGVYQAGTLSGNPVAMAAGLKTLEVLSRPGTFEALEATTKVLADGFRERAERAGIPLQVNHMGSMLGLIFTEDGPVRTYQQVVDSDTARYGRFFHGMLENGVYLAPAAFEASFVSTAHDDDVVELTLDMGARVMQQLGD